MKKGPPSRRQRHRLRLLFAIAATTSTVGSALLLMRWADHHADPWERGPASVLAPEEQSLSPCRNLFEQVCLSQSSEDPTGEVHSDQLGEGSAERIRDEVRIQHPGWDRGQVDRAVAAEIFSPQRRMRIQSAFNQARLTIEQILQRQPRTVLSQKNRRELLSRIRQIKLVIPPPATVFQDDPDMLYRTDAVYERLRDGRLRIRIGGAYMLTVRSRFNQIFTLAHEIAHAIDPCELEQAGIAPRAYPAIKRCLLSTGLVALRDGRKECEKADQLSETFADWLATQVVGETLGQFSTEFSGPPMLQAVINSVKDLCEQEGTVHDLDFHPSPQTRINGIFGRNAQIRSILGCTPEPRQERECSWQETL